MSNKCWIARDFDGDIYMHMVKPVEDYVTPRFWRSGSYVNISKSPLDKAYSFLAPGTRPIEVLINDLP